MTKFFFSNLEAVLTEKFKRTLTASECSLTLDLKDGEYLIHSTGGVLMIRTKDNADFSVDFLSGETGFRLKQGHSFKEPLAKALGRGTKTVLDGMAGFGSDGMKLATLDFKVTLLEKNPLVFELLSDGFRRANASGLYSKWIENVLIKEGDVREYLSQCACNAISFDAVYLDPMYPDDSKKRLSKKSMKFLMDWGSPMGDEELTPIIEQALSLSKRVVVKRSMKRASVGTPNTQIVGSNIRFDVYLRST